MKRKRQMIMGRRAGTGSISACLGLGLSVASIATAACGGDESVSSLPDAGALDGSVLDSGVRDAGHNDEDAGLVDAQTPEPPMPVCSKDGFCWEQPAPQGETLRAAWAASASDVWLVGEHGSLLHYDGAGFVSHNLPQHTALRDVHGSASDDVWAVGDRGLVFHFDGQQWKSEDLSMLIGGAAELTSGGLFAIFASSPSSVWAVGSSGVSALILHYDGKSWSSQLASALSDQTLRAVWAAPTTAGKTRVWAAGDKGVIASFDGDEWQLDSTPTQAALHSIHGLTETQVWAVGDSAMALRWDGTAWKRISEGLTGTLNNVRVNRLPAPPPPAAGTGGGAGGAGGDAMSGNAGTSAAGSGGAAASAPMAPQGPWLVYAFGERGHVFRYNGEVWAELPSGTDAALLGAARLKQDAFMAVGERGQLTRFMDDGRLTMSTGSRAHHLGLWQAKQTLWAVGDGITKHDVSGWDEVPRPSERALYGVWADDDAVWAVGTAGTIIRMRDSDFEPLEIAAAGDTWLRSIYGAGSSLWIVGDRGLALTAAAGGFVEVATPVRTVLHDVWGNSDDDFWAVGEASVVLRWDGMRWLQVPLGMTQTSPQALRAVWGTGADDVWVVGTESTLLHWNGSRFESHSPSESYTLNDVWGRSSDDVYAVGSSGVVLHYDGEEWTALDSGTSRALQGVSGDAQRVFVAGLDGVLLVRRTQ